MKSTLCFTLLLALTVINVALSVNSGIPIPVPGRGSTFRQTSTTKALKGLTCGSYVDPCTEFFPRVDANTYDICNGQTVALTFDDGPDCGLNGQCVLGSTNIEQILDILENYNVKATFFVNTNTTATDFQNFGGPVASQPTKQSTLQRIVNEGHLLASHSASHPDFTKLSADQIETQLASVESTLSAYTTNPITCFRTPFGAPYDNKPVSGQALSTVAPVVAKHAVHIGWTNTGQDYVCPFDSQCVTDYYSPFFAGGYTGILTMHAVYSSTVKALGGLLQQAQQAGYTFVSAEYYVQQKYGKDSAAVVAAFSQCSQYSNSQDLSNMLTISSEFQEVCPPLRVE